MEEPRAHQLSMSVLMTPDMANFTGKVHGGELLSYLDKVAYAVPAVMRGGMWSHSL